MALTKIKGTLETIEYHNTNGHQKKVITIVPDHRQIAFIEFRGREMKKLTGIKEGDEVEVSVMLFGNKSKTTGLNYNNLVGETITKI